VLHSRKTSGEIILVTSAVRNRTGDMIDSNGRNYSLLKGFGQSLTLVSG